MKLQNGKRVVLLCIIFIAFVIWWYTSSLEAWHFIIIALLFGIYDETIEMNENR